MPPMPRFVALAITLGIACNGADGDATGGGTGGGPTSAAPTEAAATTSLPPGPVKPGWERSFVADPAALNCVMSADEMAATAAARLTFGDSTIYIGYEQDGVNQNPVFARYDGGVQVYCEHHEQESPDGRAYGLTWDGGPIAYVVYTIVGGGSAFDEKGKGGWLDRYGDGGGSSKVSFVGEVETAFGTLARGTFVIAKKMDGKTNTHGPTDALIL